ncbi:MAG TPA: ABC transporter ATP-binding protein [Hansschlegelia sp.]
MPLRGGGRLEVLRDIELAVRHGQIHALLGPSGCGKSTLLNIVAGLLPLDSGRLEIDGVDSAAFRDWAAIGYMFQDDRLLPWRTVQRNVELALENQPLSRDERRTRAAEIIGLVGLTPFAQSFPNELSGGMRARVALARSLVRRPRILLMDEPFSRLDAQTRGQMHAELVRLRELFDMTVLFVTHDIDEAAVLADTVTVLAPRPGRVVETFALDGAAPRDATSPEATATIRTLRDALGGQPAPARGDALMETTA